MTNIDHIDSSPYRTPCEVVNFINLHKYGLIHFNRMSNYIIPSLYVVMDLLLDNIFSMNVLQYWKNTCTELIQS